MYRKYMVNGLKNLLYLDDRPVKPIDRLCAEAFVEGGRDKEFEVRKEFLEAERNKMRENVRRTREIEEAAKKTRQLQIESIKKDVRDRKNMLLDKRNNLREMIRTARLNADEKQKTQWAIQAVDDELASDMFHITNDDDIVVPATRRVADQRNQPQERERREQQRRDDQEREARERERKEYEERERVGMPKAQGIIPTPVQETSKIKTRAQRMRDEGVVVSTDSESENDPTLFAKRAGYRKEIFKWTQFYENRLEEMLIKHMFDFIKVAHEFSAMVNDFDNDEVEDKFYYEITPKILQLKWTDIEIKNFRMHEFTIDEEEDPEYLEKSHFHTNEVSSDSVQSFDTDEPVRSYSQTSTNPSPEPFQGATVYDTTGSITSFVNKFHEFSSSSDDDDNEGCTNLEELD